MSTFAEKLNSMKNSIEILSEELKSLQVAVNTKPKCKLDVDQSLCECASAGLFKLVVFFIEEMGATDFKNALWGASENGHTEIVEYITKYIMDAQVIKHSIHLASENGHLNIIKFMIKEKRSKNYLTALLAASKNGHQDIVEYILPYVVNAGDYDWLHEAIVAALKADEIEIAKYIASKLEA